MAQSVASKINLAHRSNGIKKKKGGHRLKGAKIKKHLILRALVLNFTI